MEHQVIFDSEKHPEGEVVGLACGYISQNEISFIRENCIVTVEAKTGKIVFCDSEGNQRLAASVELPRSGDEKFSEVKCMAEGDRIKLGFPQYAYKDSYPNCDGEHDRWTKYLSGFTYVCYDRKKNGIIA